MSAGEAREPWRILFIGNSLTYTNDLPAMVVRIARADGRKVTTRMIARPNHALEDHLAGGEVRRAFTKETWDVVVLQQGPSSLDESRQLLIRDVKAIAELLTSRPQTRIAVLMVWPPRNRQFASGRVADSHRLAAESIGGTLIPAGSALEAAQAGDAGLALLGADGFHPAPLGTYLVALTTYRSLGGSLPAILGTRAAANKAAASRLEATDEQLLALLGAAQRVVP